jgi:hypothetical protein
MDAGLWLTALRSSHWPSGLGGQLSVDCFVNRSTGHGLEAGAEIHLCLSKMELASICNNHQKGKI